MNIINQKYVIILLLLAANGLLIGTFITNKDKWYIYLGILSLASIVNASSSLLMLGYKMFKKPKEKHRDKPCSYIYVVPCYNENEDELTNSINSITEQHVIPGDIRSMIIVCDGKVVGSDSLDSTNIILKTILKNINEPLLYTYTTWDNKTNTVELYKGVYSYKNYSMDYILLVKNINYGKRDSLVLVRKLCYNYNNNIISDNMISYNLIVDVANILNKHDKIQYIIGIDADTIFDYNCSYELIKEIDSDDGIHGCVGLVDISKDMKLSPFVLYQYAEYMFAQCLRRQTQSSITNKVSCLSGCNQILRISKETCGEVILSKFNYLPKEDENIFNHIRSYASEDRNHVCLMLSLYPYIKTVQTLKAIAYTIVPTKLKIFMSQRRRWSLGANSNDMMLVYLPNINIFERISAFVNILIYSLSPFVFVATIFFIISIITEPTYLMLLLSILIIIPFGYALLIPIVINPLSFREAMLYYLSLSMFTLFGSFINLFIYMYSISNMDIIKWGKTRSINTRIKPSYEVTTKEINNHIDNINIGRDEYYVDDELDNRLRLERDIMSRGNKEKIIQNELFDTHTTKGCIVSPLKRDLSHSSTKWSIV